MASKKLYPDWVMEFKKPGYVIKEHNGSFYYYRRTSRRIPGIKNPQPYDKYIGIIDKEHGLVESDKRLLDVKDIYVYEYGFSCAVVYLCPTGWKNVAGQDWEPLLHAVILSDSERSYLTLNLPDQSALKAPEIKERMNTQKQTLYRRIKTEYDVSREQLLSLGTIQLLRFGMNDLLSHISDDQAKMIKALNIPMEVY